MSIHLREMSHTHLPCSAIVSSDSCSLLIFVVFLAQTANSKRHYIDKSNSNHTNCSLHFFRQVSGFYVMVI